MYVIIHDKHYASGDEVNIFISDPRQTTDYLAKNVFLPVVNNNNNSKFADKESKMLSTLLFCLYQGRELVLF